MSEVSAASARLASGQPLTSPYVVIDADTAAKHHFSASDTIRVSGTGRVRPFKVVGVTRFGDFNSLGGATVAIFTVPTARELLDKQGFDSISVVAKPGVAAQYLSREIAQILPATAQVKTGAEQAQADGRKICGPWPWRGSWRGEPARACDRCRSPQPGYGRARYAGSR